MKETSVHQLAGSARRPIFPISLPTPYPVGPVWVYLLPYEPMTLVDTGPATAAAWRSLKTQLAQLGFAPQDLRRVLITHGHHDHMGLARRLQRHGAQVYAHPADTNNLTLRRHFSQLWRLLGTLGVSPRSRLLMLAGLAALDTTNRPLKRFFPLADGQDLPSAGGSLRVHHLPGHSPGHVAFELEGEDLWLSGDVLLNGILPNAVLEPDPQNPHRPYPALARYRATLEKLAAHPPGALLPAHGPAITQVAALARETLWRQEQRAKQILQVLEEEPKSVASLLARLHPKARGLSLFLAYSDLYGHLLHLEEKGLVQRVPVGGIDRFARRRLLSAPGDQA